MRDPGNLFGIRHDSFPISKFRAYRVGEPGDYQEATFHRLIVTVWFASYYPEVKDMLTYIARPRALYPEPLGAKPQFPCAVDVIFTFEPGSAFGVEGPVSKTVPVGVKMQMGWSVARGKVVDVVTEACLQRVKVELCERDLQIGFDGASMKISFEAASLQALKSIVDTYYYGIPALLSIDMLDAPVISDVRATVGQIPFRWGFREGKWNCDAVTREIQEDRIVTALNRLKLLDESQGPRNRRLLAATQYFYRACRLRVEENDLGEFLAESLLNQARILEVLFPGPLNKTKQSTRAGLKSLGFSEEEIEALYIPAIELRNKIDVAHPTLGVFSEDEAPILYRYADAAEGAFRRLLQRVYERVAAGTFTLDPLKDISPSAKARETIKRLTENLIKYEEIHGSKSNMRPP